MDNHPLTPGRSISLTIMLLAFVLSGCRNLQHGWPNDGEDGAFLKSWQERAETSRGTSPGAKPRILDLPERQDSNAPSAPGTEEEPQKPLPTQVISELAMRDTPVPVVLRSLAKVAEINILISENVTGTINIELREVPWDQAFRGIIKTQNLRFQWEGDILRVMTVKDLQEQLQAEKIEQERLMVAEDSRKAEPLIMRMVALHYADGESLRRVLHDVLARNYLAELGEQERHVTNVVSSRGSVMLDKATNTLILHAVRDDMAKMIELIETLDRPTPQILIEAHIVEATSGTARELGVEWGGLYRTGNTWVTPGSNTSDTILDLPLTPGESGGIDPVTGPGLSLPIDSAAGGGLTLGAMYYRQGKRMLYSQLQALEKESKLNILSSPSVTTLNNMEAIIESGRNVPYETASDDGGREVEWQEAVLRLQVTPHVIEGNLVKLLIDVLKDELDFDNAVTRTSAGANYPLVITKKASTSLILRDGQTTVIGGLSKENRSSTHRGVPYLKDIPGLGYLFSSHVNNKDMDELLIFITPYVLPARPADE